MPRKKDSNKQKKESKKNLETSVYNLKGQVVGKLRLSEDIFAAKINPVLMTQAVRVYQVNQRLGTHAVKTRTQVSGSTRKIYRQKGTGRARHGDIKAPIFIGGGVAHGPKPYDYHLSIPAKMKRLAFFASLTDKLQSNNFRVISGLDSIEAKTKNIIHLLKNLSLTQKDGSLAKKTLLVLPDTLKNIVFAGRNLENFNMREVKLLNTYDVIASHNILFMKESVKILEDHFLSRGKKTSVELEQKKETVKPLKKTTSSKVIKKIKPRKEQESQKKKPS